MDLPIEGLRVLGKASSLSNNDGQGPRAEYLLYKETGPPALIPHFDQPSAPPLPSPTFLMGSLHPTGRAEKVGSGADDSKFHVYDDANGQLPPLRDSSVEASQTAGASKHVSTLL